MLILGIESAGAQVGCAVGGHEGVLASAHAGRGRRHAEALAPQIDFVRRQAGIELSEVGAVAVDVGPGLFTGLRVGIATAVALAQGLGVPMIPVPSLDLMAFPARWTTRLIVPALDARRGELFTALFRRVPGGIQRVRDANVCTPDELLAELEALEQAGSIDLSALEATFVAHAASYGGRRGISYAAWREVGVSAATLKAAGIRRST